MMSRRRFQVLVIFLCILALTAISGIYCTHADQEAIGGNSITAWVASMWNQTTQDDFEAGIGLDVNTSIVPGDIKLEYVVSNGTGTVADPFNNETMIASTSNLVVSGGQVALFADPGTTEALRPDGVGDETNISIQFPSSGAHWEKVDEATTDDFSTYVSTPSTGYKRDLYNIQAPSGSGSINGVTVYFRFANGAGAGTGNIFAIPYRDANNTACVTTVEVSENGAISDDFRDILKLGVASEYGDDPEIIRIAGNVYAITYTDSSGNGCSVTVEIDGTGAISDATLDKLTFETGDCWEQKMIPVSGDIYAIAYRLGLVGYLTTIEIADNGTIADTVLDRWAFDTWSGDDPDIIHISDAVYAIAYAGKGDDGYVKTVEIANNGAITEAEIDTIEFDVRSGMSTDIIPVLGNVYAIVYEGEGEDGYLKTIGISDAGEITDKVIDTLEFDENQGKETSIFTISSSVYAIMYNGPAYHGYLKTVAIAADGQIADGVIDTWIFQAADKQGTRSTPRLVHLSGNQYAVVFEGDDDAGWPGSLKTIQIDVDGQIADQEIDEMQFDTPGYTPNIIRVPLVPGGVYGRAALKTGGTVYTGSVETAFSDAFVTKPYLWATNPFTGLAWTWDDIDALQMGVDLWTEDTAERSACTQVYAMVDCSGGYTSPGTLTSINLLPGETVGSIDYFGYNASAIPAGTALDVQFSQDGTNWYNASGTEGGRDMLSQGSGSIDLAALGWTGPGFYYRMNFTSNGTETPVLDEISVSYSFINSSYSSAGTLASQVLDTGTAGARWDALFRDETLPAGTDITFEVRAGDTPFAVGDGSPAWQPEGSGLPAGRYKQWRARLTTTESATTPVLHEVRVWYS